MNIINTIHILGYLITLLFHHTFKYIIISPHISAIFNSPIPKSTNHLLLAHSLNFHSSDHNQCWNLTFCLYSLSSQHLLTLNLSIDFLNFLEYLYLLYLISLKAKYFSQCLWGIYNILMNKTCHKPYRLVVNSL